jgi:hypothetical protein
MGVGLQPLEFTECLADSPQFRENLQRHEKELERTSQQIKRLIKEVKDVVQAARREYQYCGQGLGLPGRMQPLRTRNNEPVSNIFMLHCSCDIDCSTVLLLMYLFATGHY